MWAPITQVNITVSQKTNLCVVVNVSFKCVKSGNLGQGCSTLMIFPLGLECIINSPHQHCLFFFFFLSALQIWVGTFLSLLLDNIVWMNFPVSLVASFLCHFIHLCLAALVRTAVQAFSSCSERGPLPGGSAWASLVARGLQAVWASAVVPHVPSRCSSRLQSTGSIVVTRELVARQHVGSSPDCGSNPCLLHWQADSLPPSHQGSPHMLSEYA